MLGHLKETDVVQQGMQKTMLAKANDGFGEQLELKFCFYPLFLHIKFAKNNEAIKLPARNRRYEKKLSLHQWRNKADALDLKSKEV